MKFDKATYWKRRNHVVVTRSDDGEITSATPTPQRGQGETIQSKVTVEEPGTPVYFAGKVYFLNRKQRREKTVNRKFTKKGYRKGVQLHVQRAVH